MGIDARGLVGKSEFPATSWTVIRRAQDPASADASDHLRRLIELYWRPVYHVIRTSWHRDDDAAKDLTQEFFATQVLGRSLVSRASQELGSFRALVRASLAHFMSNVKRGERRLRRGGGAQIVALDDDDVVAAAPPVGADGLTTEEQLDGAWKDAVVARALDVLRERLVAEGRAATWELFQKYDIEGDRTKLSYEELGAPFGLTVDQVKYALRTARALFKPIVVDIVREYVDGPDELAQELRSLFG